MQPEQPHREQPTHPAPPPYPPQHYPYPPYVIAHQPPSSGNATGSLVCGILGAVGFSCILGIPSILAVILGHSALKECPADGSGKRGRGSAIAGLILGYLFGIPCLIFGLSLALGGGLAGIEELVK